MKLSYFYAAVAALLQSSSVCAASDKKSKPQKPCTIRSPTTDRFFDLNPIWITADNKRSKEDKVPQSWHARGHDYGVNFTINFCGPVVEPLEDVVGVDKANWGNVSAFYKKDGEIYSIGQQNAAPVFRGRKLVLNYTDGSPCDSIVRRRKTRNVLPDDDDEDDDHHHHKDKPDDDDDDNDDYKTPNSPKKPASGDRRRKATIISLLCEKDPLADKATLSFVAASEDECTYFFEARSSAACGGIEEATQTLSPGGVFGVIALIAILVYLAGGCVYQRTVMHQRGWRQLPNYSLWAGIGGFFKDMIVILGSSCLRLLPRTRGYSRVSSLGGNRGGRDRHSDDENRLIDQLDEEWED